MNVSASFPKQAKMSKLSHWSHISPTRIGSWSRKVWEFCAWRRNASVCVSITAALTSINQHKMQLARIPYLVRGASKLQLSHPLNKRNYIPPSQHAKKSVSSPFRENVIHNKTHRNSQKVRVLNLKAKLQWFIVFHISILGAGSFFEGNNRTTPPWQRDWVQSSSMMRAFLRLLMKFVFEMDKSK